MSKYNKDLVENGQSIVDAWSYEQQPIDLGSMNIDSDNPIIGYIEIPDMKIRLGLDAVDDFETAGGINREKIVSAESMTRDEACIEMEYTDHDFYVFKDAEAGDMLCVMYRRKAGGYGVLTITETI